jgi:hypothetical protein
VPDRHPTHLRYVASALDLVPNTLDKVIAAREAKPRALQTFPKVESRCAYFGLGRRPLAPDELSYLADLQGLCGTYSKLELEAGFAR